MGPRRAGLLLVGAGCAAAGIGSLALARHAPAASFAGGSAVGATVELGAGWGLCLAGGALAARSRRVVGALLLMAGISWFAPEWANPSVGSSLLFTAGLAASAATFPFVAHAALAYPDGRLRSTLDRLVVVGSYAAAIGLMGSLRRSSSTQEPRDASRARKTSCWCAATRPSTTGSLVGACGWKSPSSSRSARC